MQCKASIRRVHTRHRSGVGRPHWLQHVGRNIDFQFHRRPQAAHPNAGDLLRDGADAPQVAHLHAGPPRPEDPPAGHGGRRPGRAHAARSRPAGQLLLPRGAVPRALLPLLVAEACSGPV